MDLSSTIITYFQKIVTYRLEYLIPLYFKYVPQETKHKLLDTCIKLKWYAGVVECFKHLQQTIPPAKLVDIIDLFVIENQVVWIELCIRIKLIDVSVFEPIILFYGSVQLYNIYCKYTTRDTLTHYKIVNENVERIHFILHYLTTTSKEKEYYRLVETRCKELHYYLVKQIN